MQIHTAPPSSKGQLVLGRTLTSLLDDAVDNHPNPKGFNQPAGEPGQGWRSVSNTEMQAWMEEIALGMRALGLERGQKVAFFMNSDLFFQACDLGTILAGIVNVPLYTTYAPENLVYVVEHSESKALIVSNPEMLAEAAEWLGECADVKTVVLAEGARGSVALPDGVAFHTLDDVRAKGREAKAAAADAADQLRDEVEASDVATIIYTSGTTGLPKGVLLTHENISMNAISAFTGIDILENQGEKVLTFLPMTHIYARTLSFACAGYGQQIYYSHPDRLVADLAEVQPTFFATVPRVLEKVFDKVSLGIQTAEGAKKAIGSWALGMAIDYDVSRAPSGLGAIKQAIADKLVYSKLRERLGLTHVKAVTSGGAALRADLARTFNGFGIQVLEGYGLTETSPVITNNLPGFIRAGTVGPPIQGVEVAIAEDGEILTRGPHVMKGYYKAPDKTAEVIDSDGWFHTGDIGEFTGEGYLKITDRKKALFKLSTGKYVIPQPMENALTQSPLIEQAVVVGNAQKYTTALIFPNPEALELWAQEQGLDTSGGVAALRTDAKVLAEYERLVADANREAGKDHWNQVKRFVLVPELMTVENELMTPTMKVKRGAVNKHYTGDIDRMYKAEVTAGDHGVAAVA